jgi:hypothetical protein
MPGIVGAARLLALVANYVLRTRLAPSPNSSQRTCAAAVAQYIFVDVVAGMHGLMKHVVYGVVLKPENVYNVDVAGDVTRHDREYLTWFDLS